MKINAFYPMLFVFTALASCTGYSEIKGNDDTTTKGMITVSCDESLKPLIEAEQMVFEQLYPNAKINITYCSEAEAVQLMLKDSARMAIITRELTTEETEILKKSHISHARYHKLGYDAIAFILNQANQDTFFSLAQVKSLLSGEFGSWHQINKKNTLGKIQLVFDNPSSGAVRFLQDSVLGGKKLGNTSFALKSNPEVIKYIQENKNAIGIIGVSWISDKDDSLVSYFLNTIKVAEIQPALLRVAGITNKPIQGNIALKQYPYWRKIIVASRELREGLGTGFASFMESEPGQKIILKGGLVPYRSSIRTIEINKNQNLK
ncbi:MAG: substrate-binding domain-containing protein [Bacteroidia bacterium]|nr:substrate-binding domain-containing protein [Bacteroidia bacterium]